MNKKSNSNFFNRWSRKKNQTISENSKIFRDEEKINNNKTVNQLEKDIEENDLTDFDLCKKYKLPDITKCKKQKDYDIFLTNNVPERLRYIALRQIWKLNPIFSRVSELVEYGEDFTDAATVVPDMQTAYKVGKGYLDKILNEKKKIEQKAENVSKYRKVVSKKIKKTKKNKLKKDNLLKNNDKNLIENKNTLEKTSQNFSSNKTEVEDSKKVKNPISKDFVDSKSNKILKPKRMIFKKV